MNVIKNAFQVNFIGKILEIIIIITFEFCVFFAAGWMATELATDPVGCPCGIIAPFLDVLRKRGAEKHPPNCNRKTG